MKTIIFLLLSFFLLSDTSNSSFLQKKTKDEIFTFTLSKKQQATKKRVFDYRGLKEKTFRTSLSQIDYAYSDMSDTYRRTLIPFNDTSYQTKEPFLGTIGLNAFNAPYQPMVGKIVSTFNNVYCVSTSSYLDLTLYGSGYLFGKNMVLTAGHVVYKTGKYIDSSGIIYSFNEHFADSVIFKPNLYFNTTTIDSTVNNIIIDDDYYMNVTNENDINEILNYRSQINFAYDWSVLTLTTNVGDTYGYCGTKTNESTLNLESTYTFGYPTILNSDYGYYRGIMTSFTDLIDNQYDFVENSLNFDISGNSGGAIVSEYTNNNLPYSYGILTWQINNDNKNVGGTILNKYMLKLGEEYGNGWNN